MNILIISGPSGSGKSTIAAELGAREPERYELIRSVTTRPPRTAHEFYTFVSEEQFLKMQKQGDFLETNLYGGCHSLYGTPRRETERVLKNKKTPILEIDVHGREQIVRWAEGKKSLHVCSVFVTLPTEMLMERLRKRGEAESSIEKRLLTAGEERKAAFLYDLIVMNFNLEETVSEIQQFVRKI